MLRPLLVGIVNITEDSFSDGGRFLDPAAATAQARRLAAGNADIVELGAAASNVAAKPVGAEEEIRRLEPVIAALQADGTAISVDSYTPEASLSVLAELDRLKQRFGLPVMVSVSRKSFLGAIAGHKQPGELGAATLAAELYAAAHGADLIRTHDPAALRDALTVAEALNG